tara:strand:+ start:363 stop:575 length:213 start_codon:yes stop_codon:yes gene_type:complete
MYYIHDSDDPDYFHISYIYDDTVLVGLERIIITCRKKSRSKKELQYLVRHMNKVLQRNIERWSDAREGVR